MSGAMCLFFTSEVHAQNNARREFKFYQENIRTKKRNNDLQKARRAKGRSNHKNGNKIRLRYLTGKTESDKLKSNHDGYEVNEIKSLKLLYNSIGIGITNYKNEGCYDNLEENISCSNYRNVVYQRANANVYSFLYNWGNSIFLTIEIDLFATGELKYLKEDGSEEVLKNAETNSFPSILIGTKLSFFEFVMEYNMGSVQFKRSEDSYHNVISAENSLLFGIGIVF